MQHRTKHFMPPALLESQFATLEQLGEDESGVVIDVSPPLDEVVEEAVNAVRVHYTT
jgi:gluconokinase